MSFQSGPMTFRRYFVPEPAPDKLTLPVRQAIQRCAFGEYGTAFPEQHESGWISPVHLFDTDFTNENIVVGRFLHLSMRVDRLAAPPGILHSYIRSEEQAMLEESGREFLGRKEKLLARTAAKERAEAEAKAGQFRRVAAYPVVYDMAARVVYASSTSETVHDKFLPLFRDTFGASPEPVTLSMRTLEIAEELGARRSLEDARPLRLTPPPSPDAADPAGMSGDPGEFLGREFLTWMWFRSECDEHEWNPGDRRLAALTIDRVLNMKCDHGLTGSVSIRNDAPAASPEARAALSIGKQPVSMGLTLADGRSPDEYSFVLDAERLSVSGLKVPTEEDEPDPVARLEERFQHMVDLAAIVDGLLASFVRVRVSSDWADEARNMCDWALGAPAQSGRPASKLASA